MAGICPQYPDSKLWCPFYNENDCGDTGDRDAHDCVLALSTASLMVMASRQIDVSPPKEMVNLLKRRAELH